jgi:short-subunit dehydrogenase
MDLSGRTVLLTGATGGIGQAVARRLHASGARLTLTGRRTDVLEPLAAELAASVIAADLADRDAVVDLARRCGEIDVLVANAALPGSGSLFGFDVEDIDRALDVNLRAPVVLARLLGERMLARGSGHIVLMSSLAGKATSGGASLYSATKFGLRGFGQALRTDLRGSGVGVSIVFPGFVRDAGMFHDSGATLPSFVGTSTPEQVAAAVADAIQRDRAEVDVAPLTMRAGVKVAELAPTTIAALAQRIGGARLAGEMSDGQQTKR